MVDWMAIFITDDTYLGEGGGKIVKGVIEVYTLYVKDGKGCRKVIQIAVPFTTR